MIRTTSLRTTSLQRLAIAWAVMRLPCLPVTWAIVMAPATGPLRLAVRKRRLGARGAYLRGDSSHSRDFGGRCTGIALLPLDLPLYPGPLPAGVIGFLASVRPILVIGGIARRKLARPPMTRFPGAPVFRSPAPA